MASAGEVECPVCGKYFASIVINVHANRCLATSKDTPPASEVVADSEATRKRKSSSPVGPNTNKSKRANTGQVSSFFARLTKRNKTDTVTTSISTQKPVVIDESSSGSDSDSEVEVTLTENDTSACFTNLQETAVKVKHMDNTAKTNTTAVATSPFSIFKPKSTANNSSLTDRTKESQPVTEISSFSNEQSSAAVSRSLSKNYSDQSHSSHHNNSGPSVPSQKEKKITFSSNIPWSEQMRPTVFSEYKGQKSANNGSLLRSLLDNGKVPSMILWGPPGCGKTTLARIVANRCKLQADIKFVKLSAATSGVSDVKDVIKVAKNDLKMFCKKTILFLDEIHRFNKTQQDSLLPHVEDGTITLIGATTENPSFQINTALLSRCRVIILDKLNIEAVEEILTRAVQTLGLEILDSSDEIDSDATSSDIYIEQKAIHTLAHLCDGDARVALNGLQMAVQSQSPSNSQLDSRTDCRSGSEPMRKKEVCVVIRTEHVKDGLQRSHILYDRAGEEHYNCSSAMIKSMRGSDDSAALYWMTRMLEGGEDPRFVGRRLVIFASEDVGLADPGALNLAVSTLQACQLIGMPESGLIMAECVVYLARAPKSVETHKAHQKAQACIRNHEGPLPSVPLHLRNAPTKLMKNLGYASGYKYNPKFDEPVDQQYLPEALTGTNFFN